MVYVTFDELVKQLQRKAVTVIQARFEVENVSEIAERFFETSTFGEMRSFVRNKFGNDIPFVEIDRIEDRFFVGILNDLEKDFRKE